MYVHAYQSFVWNTVAGKRWETFGKQVVEGDLVVVGEKERQEGTTNGKVAEEEVDEDGEPIIHPSASLDPNAPFMPGEIVDPFVRARPLSKEEAASGRYTIFDIVLPLPGFDVVYPKNEIGKFYEHFMGSDEGGRLDPHNMRRSWKDISLSGDYRKMMARPLGRGVEVEVKAYGDVDEQLVQTDLEKLEEANGGVEKTVETGKESSTTEKNKLAVILKMQLGSSQYATMALRELTKGGAVGFTPNYSVANR
jgi:tRNA pseudouridine13 synthase